MFTRRTKTLEGRQWLPVEWSGLSGMTASTGNGEDNRLVVFGIIDELVGDMIRFGKTIGWSIISCNENGENAQRIADVHWLCSEYLDKVPERDSPEFNVLLIASSLSCHGAIDRVVEKFRVRRIAILQRNACPNGADSDHLPKLFEAELSQETFAGDVIKDKMPGRETRVFSLPSSKLARESHVVRAQWDKTIQDCFSWLSEN
jgi:hypothetical protein